MIQSPFSNGGSPTPDNQATETRFTYFPTTVVTNADQVTSQGDVSGTSAALGQVTAAGGESYLPWCALCVLSSKLYQNACPDLEGRGHLICKIQLHYKIAKNMPQQTQITIRPPSPGKIFWIRATGGNKRKVEEYNC